MRTNRWVMLLALAVACKGADGAAGSGGGSGNGGVEPVVGAYCSASEVSSAVTVGLDWSVHVFWNETHYRDVAGTDGIVRRQEVRSCQSGSCYLYNFVGQISAAEAIRYCADLLRP